MQEFSDKEVSAATEAIILEHLAICERCRELLDSVKDDKTLLNNFLNQTNLSEDESSVPEFVFPAKPGKKIYILVSVIAAAAIITGFIFLMRPGKQHFVSEPIPEAELLMYEFYEGKDLIRCGTKNHRS